MKNLYIDTNVLVYAVNNTNKIYGKNLNESASRLFFEVISCRYYVIISSWMLNELSKIKRLEEVKMLSSMK